jgi:serine/threonine kinase 17
MVQRSGKVSERHFIDVFVFRGKFAAVRKCTHKETGVDYAAKFIRKRRRAMDQRQDILHEVAVLKIAADSARIVQLHEVYETPTEMALILEL